MNMFQPQAEQAAWTPPKIDPAALQALLHAAPIDTRPFTAAMKEFSANVDPSVLAELQADYMRQLSSLWSDMLASKTPTIADRRFGSPEWQSNPLSAFHAAVYLLNARFLNALADAVQASPRARQKIKFAVQQMVDAMSPANFLVSNPEAQQKLIETKGESLAKGIAHMLEDMKKGRISQSDESAFEVGRNVANTEGAVVYENELFQLIQYKPLTKSVYQRPLLLVPPCINKYYILDLQPDNSLVRHAVEQGHSVFLVSWCNPDASLGHLTWDDYIGQGTLEAIRVTQEISGQEQLNMLGFCVGGTILASALAVLAARGEHPAASLTLLTTLLDFSDTGVIDVFIDEAQVAMRERTIGKGGLMPGRDFASAFSSLRPNDLVWNYVKTNYLKGETPPPFDLLYWNSDSTNLPGPMFCYYLRNMYLENNLRKPGRLTVLGENVDLSLIDAPVFVYGSREDHIVPWAAAYESTALLNPRRRKRNRFVLGASGHIAGVINPPAKKKRSYWVNEEPALTAEAWLAGAAEHPGSWWPEWTAFLKQNAGKQVAAPKRLGNAKYKPIEPAPGRYVKVKAE
ncbi:MAG TPA: class I poly(R)-hydroxyalkanoic acid synthase [Noviherbaspirillum sp.]|nr:class I poly(R)-hydroxyalkanoic acid synthase [Noviherbaspirillum sp.]